PDGKITVNNLAFGPYYFVETVAPNGYEENTEPQAFTIGEGQVEVPFDLKVPNTKLPDPVGSVTLLKHEAGDEGKVLEGAKFMLYSGVAPNGTPIDEYETGPDGKITVNNLVFGSYYFVETVAPNGYEENTEPHPFTIGEGQVEVPFDLKVANTKLPDPVGSVTLLKHEAGDEGKVLEGAKFMLYSGVAPNGIPMNEYETGPDGKITVNNLAFGSYYFVETVAPSGYEENTEPQPFTIGEGQVEVPFDLKVPNTKLPDPVGSVELLKQDGATKQALQGARFELYQGTSEEPGDLVGTYTTGADGKLKVDNLLYGDYHFVEVQAPDRYITDGKPINFAINSSTTTVELTMDNVKDYQPQIQTLAFETGTNKKQLYPGMATQISDRVSYQELTPGKSYRLEAKLMTKDGQKTLTQGTRTFTATSENGEETVALDAFDARALKGQQVVVFEQVIDVATSDVVARHESLNDADQTVTFLVPSLQTFAFETGTDGQYGLYPHPDLKLSDRVVYTNLNPGERYTLEATLVDKVDGALVFTQGTHSFIPETASGEVAVPLDTFDATSLKGNSYVVFEVLKDEDGQIIADHRDTDSLTQGISFVTPTIKTNATDKATGEHEVLPGPITIVDNVSYTNLDPSRTYQLSGVLMDKATGAPLIVDGSTVTATKTFQPESTEGFTALEFDVDTSDLKGKDIVVFETLMLDGVVVAIEKNINEESQTIKVANPTIRTTLQDKETGTGTQNPSPEEDITLVDTIHYEDLLVGREYTVKGTLMDKTTKAPLLVDGEKVEAEATFTPETTSGDVEVTFTFNAKGLAGKDIVAFESLYAAGQLIAKHEDFDDENQTVQFKKPDLQTVAADTDGSKDIEPTDKQVVDLVNYKDLIPGKEYTVKGKLMDKATGNSVLIAGKEVLGETTFTPEESNGSVEVYFNLDARELAGRYIVVFEKLYRNGKEVVTHEDINDVSQTVTFTKQPTTKPEPPNNNPSTNKPGTPSTPGISETTGSAGTNKKNSTLPGTGDTTAPYDILIGILLVASGTVLLRKRRQ
ncbi:VaFE repeat-containing surface-anchored protein, partial [Listeria booriae]